MKYLFCLFLTASVFAQAAILKTLVVYDNYDAYTHDTATYKDKVVITFKDKDLSKKLKIYIGKEITQQLLIDIKTTAVEYYKDKGFPFVSANFPEGQDVTDGLAKLLLTKGKLGKVKAEGGRYFSNDAVIKAVNIKQGDPVCVNNIMDNISFLNRDPFRSVDVIYERGEDVGDTNILLQIKDRFPIKVYAMFDHNRYPVAGNYRQTYGVQMGSLFRKDQRVEAQVSAARDFYRWWCFSGNYFIPIQWRHILRVFGNYCQTNPEHQDNAAIPVGSTTTGRSWQIGGRFHSLFNSIGVLKHELVVGFDMRRTNNFENYGINDIYIHKIGIVQFMASYEGSFNWSTANAAFALSIIFSPGSIGPYNTNPFFAQEREGAKCTYSYQVLHFNFSKDIKGATLLLDGIFQYSSALLMPTEEMAVGGHLSVRGYDENEVIGDKGGQLKLEFRMPSGSLLAHRRIQDSFRAIGFVDFGFVTNADKNVIDANTAVLFSIGPGARYEIKDHLNFYFDFGIQLKSVHGRLWGSDSKSRIHVGLAFNF
jgi:hemolysin activation/secretion protein